MQHPGKESLWLVKRGAGRVANTSRSSTLNGAEVPSRP